MLNLPSVHWLNSSYVGHFDNTYTFLCQGSYLVHSGLFETNT